MRKDAKLTFIIGGILLAVLIVYVLVPSKKHGSGVALDEGNKGDQSAAVDNTGSVDTHTDLTKSTDSSASAVNCRSASGPCRRLGELRGLGPAILKPSATSS